MKKEKKGLWIAFEGFDGSGKTTQLKKVAEYLRSTGRDIVETREPGGNPYSEKLRGMIFDPEVAGDPQTQLLAFVASRRRNIINTVVPALNSGKIVLSDRSEGSSYAYQHYQFGLPLQEVKQVNDFGTDGIKPDYTLLLDVDLEVGRSRVQNARGEENNHFDTADLEIWKKRKDGYLDLATNFQAYGLNPWYIIDANQSQEKVFAQIEKVLEKII